MSDDYCAECEEVYGVGCACDCGQHIPREAKDSIQRLVVCEPCSGTGKMRAAFEPIEITCDMCGGKGEHPREKLEWIKVGKRIKLERLAKKIKMRDAALALDLSPSIYSMAERGVIDPSIITDNEKSGVTRSD